MLHIDKQGRVINPKVKLEISLAIEVGPLPIIHGVVVHQTASATAAATLSGYQVPKAHGAHFLIDKDGTIYQTASLHKKTLHVGYIKSRCIAEKRCSPADLQQLRGRKAGEQTGRVEMNKAYPNRYPLNGDSIGIEIVSMFKNGVFELVTDAQQTSLQWLLTELMDSLALTKADIYRHAEVSWKQESEGASARW